MDIQNLMNDIQQKNRKRFTMDGCFRTEIEQTLFPWSRESRSLTCGMLFQLSPRAGFDIPPSPPTVWFVTFKNSCELQQTKGKWKLIPCLYVTIINYILDFFGWYAAISDIFPYKDSQKKKGWMMCEKKKWKKSY